jgi:hypothetical protein
MHSQSYREHVAITPGADRRRAAPSRTIPSVLYWLVALAIGSSFYVRIEPAPTDLFFVVLFWAALFKRGIRFPIDLNLILSIGLLTFFAGSTWSLLAAKDMGLALFFFLVTTYLLITWYLVVVLLATYGAPMWELIQRAFLVATAVGAVVGLIAHFTDALQPYFPTYGERSRGAFKDPNVYAPFLCAALVLVINYLVTRARRFSLSSLLLVALVCLYGVEILAAFSRGAYASLGVSLIVFFSLQLFVIGRKDWLLRSFAVLGASAAVFLPASIMFLDVTELTRFLNSRLGLQLYDDARFANQARVMLILSEAPLGIGPGQIEVFLPASTHSLYLRVATENGLLSALGFCLFIAVTLWFCLLGTLRRNSPFRDVYASCLAILGGILVNSLVIDSIHWRHFFLFLAIPIGLWQHESWATRGARPRIELAPRRRGI